jgi:hypothetical protein
MALSAAVSKATWLNAAKGLVAGVYHGPVISQGLLQCAAKGLMIMVA